ncbi:sugar phosphate isomerase/epimerase family protein [Micromonospora halotolerans]|uniref:Sugar phosphate isomerase/epimerase family protein n=1 Tax=Micromonospora halotolerans TaxID=709879 RepID=A0ABY9ZTU5_9ACTN|nr:sugar phosphate isomerase/epimerase family protein [Micromonospora halotolerans]WNM38558.1 sugar phosphate isomerase/epimerase family protein [Micromonospora halotolerans]
MTWRSRHTFLSTMLAAVLTMTALAAPPAVAASPDDSRPEQGRYYTGDFKISLNLYSFNINMQAWLKNRKTAPPIDTLQAIRFAKEAGFDAVDVTSYYIPGFDFYEMPTKPRDEIMDYARQIRSLCEELDIDISGTGASNDFASADPARRALDLERVKFWIDVAAEMGAPVMRVFSGVVPEDIDQLGWAGVAQQRVVPALQELADYGAARGVDLGLQNHGDMTATAEQTIQIMQWVNRPNIGIIDDTGYFRPFGSATGLDYDWYGDIAKVLPHTNNFQLKKKPAGAETDELMDLERVFTDLRLSSYRGYVPLELLWVKGEPGYPRDLDEPPFAQIEEFFAQVKDAMHATQDPPFDGIRTELDVLRQSGDLQQPAYALLTNTTRQAEHQFTSGHSSQSIRSLEDFLRRLDSAASRGQATPTARQQLAHRVTALHDSFVDVFS